MSREGCRGALVGRVGVGCEVIGMQERERLVAGEPPVLRAEVLGEARRCRDDARERRRESEVDTGRGAVVGVEDSGDTSDARDVHAGGVPREHDVGPERTGHPPELPVAPRQLGSLTEEAGPWPTVRLVGDLVRVEERERDVLVAREHAAFIAFGDQAVMQVLVEVHVRRMHDVEEHAHGRHPMASVAVATEIDGAGIRRRGSSS